MSSEREANALSGDQPGDEIEPGGRKAESLRKRPRPEHGEDIAKASSFDASPSKEKRDPPPAARDADATMALDGELIEPPIPHEVNELLRGVPQAAAEQLTAHRWLAKKGVTEDVLNRWARQPAGIDAAAYRSELNAVLLRCLNDWRGMPLPQRKRHGAFVDWFVSARLVYVAQNCRDKAAQESARAGARKASVLDVFAAFAMADGDAP